MKKYFFPAVHPVIFIVALYFLNIVEMDKNEPFEFTEKQVIYILWAVTIFLNVIACGIALGR